VGEAGEEGVELTGRSVRRLIVTLLDVCWFGGCCMPVRDGVRGGADSPSELAFSSGWDIESGVVVGMVVSADVLREPRR